MSQIDIVARLQLRADQFSSETGQRFAEMKSRAASTAQEIRTEFTGAFAEVQKLSKTALEMPRTRSGALDLSGEITSLRQSAAAADLKATAARQLSVAMAAAAQSERTVTESMRLEADAAMVAARAEEANATAIRQRILALEAVQTELNKTAVVTTANTKAANDNSVSLGQQRQSTMMLGQQVQDFAVQAANGGSIATAFSQQVGQAAFALNGMDGAAGKVGAFLATGWGTAVLVGLTVLTPLVSKILDGNDALEDAVGKLRKDAEETRVAAEAKDRFSRSEEGLTAAIREQLAAQQKAIEAERTAAETADINARARLNQTLQIRQQTAALLEQAIAQEQVDRQRSSAPGQRGELATLALNESAGRVAGLQAQLQANQQAITDARTAYNNAQVDLAAEQAKRAADPIERINEQYRQMERNARNAARGNAELTKGLFDQVKALEQRRKAAVQAEQDRQSAARAKPPALGTQIRNERASDILAAAQRYTGAREDTASGRATLKDLFSTAGISIDPDKVAWCAAFVNAVLSGQGIKGTGSLSARSFLGYGTATDRPTQGDIVVLKRGNNTSQGHVGFYAGERGGRVMVTGGNQGDAVGTQSFARSDVLGFRRAPTASADFKSNAREAAQEVKELDRALESVKKRFDPATAAAADFAELLGKVTELKAAGRLTAQEADDLTFKALIEEGARRRDAQLKAWKDALGDVPDMAAGVGQYDQEQAAKWDRASVDLQESQQRRAEANLRDLSDLYYDLFDGSSANIWANFQRRAFGALADVAAKETVKLFSLGGQSQQGGGDGDQAAVEQLKSINAGITKLPFGISKETAKTVIQGAGIGAVGGSVFASITGGKNNAVASSVGGVLGDVAGKAIGKSVAAGASGLLKSLGGAAGPLGAIAGGVLGSLVGGLFQKTKQASSTLTFGAGGLGAAGAVGTGTAEKAAASASANSVVGSLNRIAEALGGDVTGAGSVSIGYRPGHKDGAYRVDTTGQGRLTGVLAFATEEEAIRAAIADALKDGVIGGISAASRRILAAGGDLEKAITKASLIESVPKSLKAMLDPVGAAVDDLNRSFQKTVDALKEGGATAEQMAQAQQLYDLQLAQVKNSTESASASLKSFRDSMVVGSASPLSLRDQEAAAVTKLQPFLEQIAAGKAIDQAKYQEAARSYLDVERQLYGSTQAFFEAFDRVQASTAKAIATIDNAVPVTAGVASPFAKETAASAAATAAGVQTGNQMTENTNDLLAQLVAQNAQLIAAMNGGGSGSGFIGSNRSFVAAR